MIVNHPDAADWPIERLPGLSQGDRTGLQTLGIATTMQLVRIAQTDNSRRAIARQLGTKVERVARWQALAELAQVPGVGYQHCGLLLHAGIVSLVQLAQIQPSQLRTRIVRVQVANFRRSDLSPSLAEVSNWVQYARVFLSGNSQGT